mgnify:CR=1 FL=1
MVKKQSIQEVKEVRFLQTVSFPKVYATQKNVLSEEWKSSVLNARVKEVELIKMVSDVFYDLLYLQEKKKIKPISIGNTSAYFQVALRLVLAVVII